MLTVKFRQVADCLTNVLCKNCPRTCRTVGADNFYLQSIVIHTGYSNTAIKLFNYVLRQRLCVHIITLLLKCIMKVLHFTRSCAWCDASCSVMLHHFSISSTQCFLLFTEATRINGHTEGKTRF